MKKNYIFIFLVTLAFSIQAQTVIVVQGGTTGTSAIAVQNGAYLVVQGGITIDKGTAATFTNGLKNDGTIELVTNSNGGSSDFNNNVAGLNTYTSGKTTGTVIFAATNATENITGGGTADFMNLTINNVSPPAVALSEDVTVDGVLSIGGVIKTQSNNLTLSASGTLAGSPFTVANMIQADGSGQFLRSVNSGSGSYLFPIGDGAPAYSPVNIGFISNANIGTVGINVTSSTHPQINNPTAALDNLQRYWTFSNTGLSNYTYTATFNYLPSDIVGTESKLKLSRWANPWYEDEASTAASDTLTTTTALNQTLAPLNGDFTGRFACPFPAITVSPQSAVCTGNISSILTASGATGYTWAPNTNISNSTGATVTAQISQLTFYTVTGIGSTGCTTTAIVPVATVATGGAISPIQSIICSGNTKTLTVAGAAGHDYIWQISTNNSTWDTIPGATNTTYTTAGGDGNTNKFYRLLARSNSCWNVASTTAEVDVSNPTITVTAGSITDNTLILNWSPTGTGNYNITYSGTSSGLLTGATPPKTITGLTANGTYSLVVTQTGVSGCSATGTLTANTLCAVPTNLTATPSTVAQTQQLAVSWNGPAGNYRVYYRPLYSYVTFFTQDVTNATTTILKKQGANNLYASNTYQIYVSRLDCPNTGNVGQPTSSIYVTTLPNPVVSCASPTIDTVFSSCPVLLEVKLEGGSGIYNVYIQRLTPTLQAVNSYGITGGDFVINALAGQQYLISADSRCGSTVSTLNIWHNQVTVKPICNAPANIVLSNPTCQGFTASWNADQCLSNTVSGYDFYMRQAGTINYNSYAVALPSAGIGPHELVNWLGQGKNMQVFVQSIYACNGSVTYGPSSQVATITTLSAGCRDEETTDQPQQNKPAIQQYSANNDEVFSLYPNPNTGEFTVDLSRLNNNTDEVRIEVMNMIGQTVITHITSISDGHMRQFINLPSGTAAGTYIVRLTAGRNVYTAKMNVSK